MADDAVDGREAVRRMPQAAEDSGIDSDGSQVRQVRRQDDIEIAPLNEIEDNDELRVRFPSRKWVFDSGSSEEDLVITKSPKPRCPKNKYNEQVDNSEEGQLDQELLIPTVKWEQPRFGDSDSMLPDSPDHSSSSIYEVELTASDEDEDSSLYELVIPLHSAARNSLLKPETTKTGSNCYDCCSCDPDILFLLPVFLSN